MDRDSSVRTATRCGLDGLGSNPGEGRVFPHPSRPALDPPSFLYNGSRFSFKGVKRPGCGVNHPPTSSAEVKEREELYFYSSSGPPWPVLGWTFTFTKCWLQSVVLGLYLGITLLSFHAKRLLRSMSVTKKSFHCTIVQTNYFLCKHSWCSSCTSINLKLQFFNPSINYTEYWKVFQARFSSVGMLSTHTHIQYIGLMIFEVLSNSLIRRPQNNLKFFMSVTRAIGRTENECVWGCSEWQHTDRASLVKCGSAEVKFIIWLWSFIILYSSEMCKYGLWRLWVF